MSDMKLPDSEKLDIGTLSRVFDRNRISNCYKYFWLQAILKNLTNKKTTFTYNEILNQMIVDAWYMVTEYKLHLGPCNTTDNLEEVVKYIFQKQGISSTAKESTIIDFLEKSDDPQIKSYKAKLIINVPYCMQSPFYNAIKNPREAKVEEINRQKHLLYYYVSIQGIESHVEMNEEWVEYLINNREILQAWVKYNLIGYLQDRNPSVPGIMDKICKPEKRDLKRVSDYWKTIITIDPAIVDIYKTIPLKDEKISVDHFVPWQYVAHDELWNLCPTTKSINSQKGNHLPPDFDQYFSRLSRLEYHAYEICNKSAIAKEKFEICKNYHVNNADVRNHLYADGLDNGQFTEILLNIIKPVYDSAKLCGFREWRR